MNIQKIYNAQFSIMPPQKTTGTHQYSYFGIKAKNPLTHDTVTFTGRGIKPAAELLAAKARIQARALRDARLIAEVKAAPEKTNPTKKNLAGEERVWGISKSTSKQVHDLILEPQQQIHDFMIGIFSDLKVSELNPKNLILKFSDRAKSVVSIMEKSATRKWSSTKEVLEKMTDLNGAKIVMNYKTGKPETETVLDRLIPLIKTGQVTLHEIELQRPKAIEHLSKKEQEEFDYFSKAFLDKLEDAQEEIINGLETDIDSIQLIDRPLPKYTKFNYCALHLIMQLNEKGSRPFELQIMGARESMGKNIDDKRFKHFEGKELDKIYRPLVNIWNNLLTEGNEAAKEEYFRYCKDANLQLRKDEIQENLTRRLISRHTGFFKTVREYNLTPEYDLNTLYDLMLKCELNKTEPVKEASENKAIKSKFSKIIRKLTPKKSEDKKKFKF